MRARLEPHLTHSVRWTRAESIHLTLRFLGECSPAQQRAITDQLRTLAGSTPPFDLVVRGLGCFPDFRRPAIVWLGIDAAAPSGRPETLKRLQRAVETIAVDTGFAAESRTFTAHVTLARIAGHASPGESSSIGDWVRETARVQEIAEWRRTVHTGHIAFMQSELSPQGARYTALDRLSLGSAGPG